MKRRGIGRSSRILWVLASVVVLTSAGPRSASAHCDTLDGPVVSDAREALESADVTPVLKWVGPEQEPEVRSVFEHALAVRLLSPEARELADRAFFETVVRLHRATEGAPYDGLKPAGSDLPPAVVGADRSLETGVVDEMVASVVEEVEHGIRERFDRAHGLRAHSDESVEAGREYVEAYVTFVHYMERLAEDAEGAASHGTHDAGDAHEAH